MTAKPCSQRRPSPRRWSTLPAGLGQPLVAATAGWLREHTDAPAT